MMSWMALSSERAPRVSVVLPAHNARRFIDAAVRSIVEQTFTDIELVIVDDASTDGTTEMLRDWARKDSRIRLFEVEENLGLTPAANYVLERARADLIARMDADDISHPDRIRREVEALDQNPEAVAVGTLWIGIDESGSVVRPRDRWRLLRGRPYAPFPHGSTMVRREAFEKVGHYRNAWYWEDFDLYLRLQRLSPFLVIPDALFSYRIHRASSRIIASPHEFAHALDLLDRCIDEFRNGRDYSPLLEEPVPPAPADYRVPARLLFIYGSSELWSGHRPKIIRDLIRNRVFPTSMYGIRIWAFGTIGFLFPKIFRKLLQGIVWIRDLVATPLLGREPRPWRFE